MRYFSEKNVGCDAIFDAMRLPSLVEMLFFTPMRQEISDLVFPLSMTDMMLQVIQSIQFNTYT